MTAILTNPQERTRFLKFMAVGVIGAVVDFGIMNLFSKLFGMSLVIAGTISFICAILSNFFWNRFWTYPDSRSRPISRQLVNPFVPEPPGGKKDTIIWPASPSHGGMSSSGRIPFISLTTHCH